MKAQLTSEMCRDAFRDAGLTYADITAADLTALQGYIAIHCAKRVKTDCTAPLYTVPRRKDDSLCAKFGRNALIKAYIKIDCQGQWAGREAISFNPDGYIGFCGWASTANSQPILSAFMEWLRDFVIVTNDKQESIP